MFILDFNKQHLINLNQVISLDVNENKIEDRIIKGNDIIGIPLIEYNFNKETPFTLSGLLCHIMRVISYTYVINKNNVIDIGVIFDEYVSKKPYQEKLIPPDNFPYPQDLNRIVPISNFNLMNGNSF